MNESTPQDYVRTAVACLDNADELLRASSGALEREQLPRVSFHLSTLALEEVGKAGLLRIAQFSKERGDSEPPSFVKRSLDDHVRKLFWAIWAPTMAQAVVTVAEIDANRELAREIHETRLQAMYVDPDTAANSRDIDEFGARSLLNMTRARLELERAKEYATSPEAVELQQWFAKVTEDPVNRRLIFGSKSMQKLAELKDPRAWGQWMKATLEDAAEESRKIAEQELARVPPKRDDPAALQPKWKVTFRLYSESHSIRQRDLNWWNQHVEWIKFAGVTGGREFRRQLDVEMTLPSGLPVAAVWQASYDEARRILIALNVAGLGLFWWQPRTHVSRFYERIIDLENNAQTVLERSPALTVDWRQSALGEEQLRNVQLVLAVLHKLKRNEVTPLEYHYYYGVAFLAKSDVHLTFEPHACQAFLTALRDGMSAYDGIPSEQFRERFKAWIDESFNGFEDRDRVLAIDDAVARGQVPDPAPTLSDVSLLKVLCDYYFAMTFRRVARERFGKGQASE